MTNTSIGLWQIGNEQPKRLGQTKVDLEAKLEEWIEKDPTLIRAGLTIVGRQLQTEGGPLDLLSIDIQGRWGVIEIKRGTVRRETLTQAIDYASCIRRMSEAALCDAVASYLKKRELGSLEQFKESHPEAFDGQPNKREVEMIVVGTGRDFGLERMVDFLQSGSGLSVSIITFEVFQSVGGERILVRELTESDEPPIDRPQPTENKEKDLCGNAARLGFGEAFEAVLNVANQHGLKKRITNKSIMYAPPSDGRVCLFLVYGNEAAKSGGMKFYASLPAFEEFFQIKQARVASILGVENVRWAKLELKTRESQDALVRGLQELLKEILPIKSDNEHP